MKLVVDANIIVASLVKEGKTADIIINPIFNLFAPEFIIEEIEKYKDEIIKKSKRSSLEEIDETLSYVLSIIYLVPKSMFFDFIDEAERISPDIKDNAYFALALKLNCPIWSNDKKLKEQNRIKVYSTKEIVRFVE